MWYLQKKLEEADRGQIERGEASASAAAAQEGLSSTTGETATQ